MASTWKIVFCCTVLVIVVSGMPSVQTGAQSSPNLFSALSNLLNQMKWMLARFGSSRPQGAPEAAALTGCIGGQALCTCSPPCQGNTCCLQKMPGQKAQCSPNPLSGQTCSYPNNKYTQKPPSQEEAITGQHCPCMQGMMCLGNGQLTLNNPTGACSFFK